MAGSDGRLLVSSTGHDVADLAALEALDGRRRPDAVIVANDMLAFGLMRAAHTARRRVAQQLAVVGIDDTQLARLFSPSLTSASLGARQHGRETARLLLERMAAPTAPAVTVRVAPRLVVRDSSAPVRHGAS